MHDVGKLEEFLAGACVDAAVFALRPDYRALLLAVDGIVPGPGDQASDALLLAAEAAAREAPGARHAAPGCATTAPPRCSSSTPSTR
jgi:hypothetical protein